MNYCITNIGAQRYNEALNKHRKIVFIGFVLNSNAVPEALTNMLEVNILSDDDGIIRPLSEQLPVKDPYPLYDSMVIYHQYDRVLYNNNIYESISVNDNLNNLPLDILYWKLLGLSSWSINLSLNIQKVTTEFNAIQIGILAQEFVIPEEWISRKYYIPEVDYVIFSGYSTTAKYYKCIHEYPNWNNTTTYNLDSKVKVNGGDQYYNSIQAVNTGHLLSDLAWWEPYTPYPDNDNYIWEIIDSIDIVWKDQGYPLIKIPNLSGYPNPFLFYYIVRNDYPVPVLSNQVIVYKLKVGITQSQAPAYYPKFGNADLGLSEMELGFIKAVNCQNRTIRDLQKHISWE